MSGKLASSSACPVALLHVDEEETAEKVRRKFTGEFKVGYKPAGAEGALGIERKSEQEEIWGQCIRGSRVHTDRGVWMLRENARHKKGIHLMFVAALAAKLPVPDNDLEADLEIRVKLGPSTGNRLEIRRIVACCTKRFDSKTMLAFRPDPRNISEECSRRHGSPWTYWNITQVVNRPRQYPYGRFYGKPKGMGLDSPVVDSVQTP
jgi:hypothetical protein